MVDSELRRIVVLTGAGISAESGIRTFRAADGLWEDHRVEDVATPEAFRRDPELVHRFYNARRRQLIGDETQAAVCANAAHLALAAFERAHLSRGVDHRFLLVTQNVDDLHERAGSEHLVHMHGELLKMRCADSDRVYPWTADCSPSTHCPCCNRTGTLRPHIVWFGEVPFQMDAIVDQLQKCDLFVSIGTSGNVYPAAGFFQIAQHHGARTAELNLEPSKNTSLFDEGHFGPATQVVPPFFEQLIEKQKTLAP